MTTVILVVHLMIAAALVGVVLLQRSEGGALGIGGGGGGGFLTGRGTANFLTRTTAILAGAFFVTSMLLTILAKQHAAPGSVFDRIDEPPAKSGSAPAKGSEPALPKLQPPVVPATPGTPSVPQSK